MTRNQAPSAHGPAANLPATCTDRMVGRTHDRVLASHDGTRTGPLSQAFHRETSRPVDAHQANLFDPHQLARAGSHPQDDSSIGHMGMAAVTTVPDHGVDEESGAVMAFDPRQERLSGHLTEHFKILASISHDLQTPITRMRLRVERLDDCAEQQKIVGDLREMEHLIREGVAYARGTLGGEKARVKMDPVAFLESLVFDYQDMGRTVSLVASAGGHVTTCPHALRRVLGNLIDNAIKYGGAAEIGAHRDSRGALCLTVSDRGQGIPESELKEVLKPFYRLAVARESDISGAGLGLAIAAQLISSIGGTLSLSNRSGGGLTAAITLP
ncbi:sensor histidine kinase [Dyella soli]|nr:HAMP domain-containing sensor histidine kinase [Dyella soli]